MELLYLFFVFMTIVAVLTLRRPLYQSVLAGIAVTIVLWKITPRIWLQQILAVFSSWDSLSVPLSLYLITYLQRMLEARMQLRLAQQDLNGLFHNRRINASIASIFIGLLPSAAAMIICGDIVKESTDDYLSPKEQAFITNWFRHIPESSLPTYSSVLLMVSLAGIPLSRFLCGMIIPIFILILIGYYPYVHRLPIDPGTPKSNDRAADLLHLFKHLWSLIAIIMLILIFKISVVPAVIIVIAVAALVYRIKLYELKGMIADSFEPQLLLNVTLVLILKDFIACTGVLARLPQTLSALPIPAYLIFAILFFVGGIISGANGIIALGAPVAFAALPCNVPLAVMLMCMCHAASQVSPTHVCLTVASEYYGITLGDLIKKTLPRSLLFCALMLLYYNLMTLCG